jgi:hypothetical protein
MAEITNAIVKHIFKGLGLYGNVPVSILHPTFKTDKLIDYTDEEYREKQAEVFACQTSIENDQLNIICVSFPDSYDYDTENFVIVKLGNSPAYGCYLGSIKADGEMKASDGSIATEIRPGAWIPTTTFLQATFLAGMEQVKELTSKYEKAKNIEDLFKLLKEFITYQNNDWRLREGQEN